MREPKIPHPKVFISYAWTSDAYTNRVASFAAELQKIGIEVLFDKFEMKPGNEPNAFMERSVNDASVTNVLLLLNKTYADKANNREGGVGKETQIISEEIYNKTTQTKFIPVVFEKGPKGEIYKPAYLGSTYFVDLSDSQKYDSEFQLLVKSIYGESVYRKPELGNPPEWVTEEITFTTKKQIEFEEIKNQSNSYAQHQSFKQALELINEKIANFVTGDIHSGEEFYSRYLEKYKSTIPIRDEYLQLLKISPYIQNSEKTIANSLESIINICQNNTEANAEIKEILLHEIFIYTIAFYLKNNMFDKVGYLLGKTYFITRHEQKASTFDLFYCDNMQKLDEAMKFRDKKDYYTGEGALWIEDMNTDFCTRDDFVLADLICFNYTIFSSQKNLAIHWFPIVYIYGIEYHHNTLKNWTARLQSMEHAEHAIFLFNYKSITEFKKCFVDLENSNARYQYRSYYKYQGAFYAAPLLCDFIKSEQIGMYK